jgi:hypothetical protein
MPNERDEARSIYLRALDQRSHAAPLSWWTPDALVAGYTEAQILDALTYLEDQGFADVRHAVGDRAMSAARITSYGQDFIRKTDAYLSDRTLSAFAHTTISFNTTQIRGSTVGNVVSGGSDNTISGNVTIQHLRPGDLENALQTLDDELARDPKLPDHVKEEVDDHLRAVRSELSKPAQEQNHAKTTHRWERVLELVIGATPPVLAMVATLSKLLLLPHGR